VVSSLTIGIPAFFLALAPNLRRAEPGFVHRVLRFAIPTGLVAAVATFAAYVLARILDKGDLSEARTLAAVVLFSVGLWALAMLAGPWTALRGLLVGSMGAAFLAVLLVPPLRDTFALDPAAPKETAIAVVVVSLAALALEGGWGLSKWRRR
jgi:cation-transporting ATPase E